MKHGDFTELADNYSKYRPGYAPFVVSAIMSLLPKAPKVADVGAGTGIWSRMLADAGAMVTAVEPNDAMRQAGMHKGSHDILWKAGSAEETNLPSGEFAMVSMASSFHWTDFEQAMREFSRILAPGGYFLALWNTRRYETNPLLVDIENRMRELAPDMKRVSSGRSAFCSELADRLRRTDAVADVLYLEGQHTEMQSPEHYLGLWESVNDVRVQMGAETFAAFLDYIREKTKTLNTINADYTTRAWLAKMI
jgi:Methylase involved in ubiquinone/menaquinone biosynthesis